MANSEIVVDARQMRCPMPLLKLKQALNKAACNDIIMLMATDPSSKRDIHSYIEFTSHQLCFEVAGDEFHFRVTKK